VHDRESGRFLRVSDFARRSPGSRFTLTLWGQGECAIVKVVALLLSAACLVLWRRIDLSTSLTKGAGDVI